MVECVVYVAFVLTIKHNYIMTHLFLIARLVPGKDVINYRQRGSEKKENVVYSERERQQKTEYI